MIVDHGPITLTTIDVDGYSVFFIEIDDTSRLDAT
jgi:hypothetical protein